MTGPPEARFSEVLAAAIAYLELGLSIFPLPCSSKVPQIAWKRFQSYRATMAMVERWFANMRANIAIVVGRISGNAVALDFDDHALAMRAFPNLEELAQITLVERTSRGYHVVFRVLGRPVGTTTLTGRGLALDVKREGSYMVAAPSTHPDGTPYKLVSPNVKIATIARTEFDALLLRLQRKQPALPGLDLSFGPRRDAP